MAYIYVFVYVIGLIIYIDIKIWLAIEKDKLDKFLK